MGLTEKRSDGMGAGAQQSPGPGAQCGCPVPVRAEAQTMASRAQWEQRQEPRGEQLPGRFGSEGSFSLPVVWGPTRRPGNNLPFHVRQREFAPVARPRTPQGLLSRAQPK